MLFLMFGAVLAALQFIPSCHSFPDKGGQSSPQCTQSVPVIWKDGEPRLVIELRFKGLTLPETPSPIADKNSHTTFPPYVRVSKCERFGFVWTADNGTALSMDENEAIKVCRKLGGELFKDPNLIFHRVKFVACVCTNDMCTAPRLPDTIPGLGPVPPIPPPPMEYDPKNASCEIFFRREPFPEGEPQPNEKKPEEYCTEMGGGMLQQSVVWDEGERGLFWHLRCLCLQKKC